MFTHGKDTKIYTNGYTLTEYLDSVDASGSVEVADTTTFNNIQRKFVAGLGDATISMQGFFDGDSTAVSTVFQSALASTAIVTYWPRGDTVPNYGFGYDGDQSAFNVSTTLDNAARVTAAVQSSNGQEPLISLHAMSAEYSAAFTGTTYNYSAASTSGGSAYMQVISAATTAIISIRHSSDNFAADNDELVAFSAATGRKAERVTFSGAVKQYVRVIGNITAGETITFNIGIYRA
jgi:hypothetical protein